MATMLINNPRSRPTPPRLSALPPSPSVAHSRRSRTARETEVIFFQMGSDNVEIKTLDRNIMRIKAELPPAVQIRVKMPDFDGSAREDSLAKGFTRIATAAIGKGSFYKDAKVVTREAPKPRTFKKEMIQIMEGSAKIDRDKLHTALRRSGADGVILDSTEYDEHMTLLNVPSTAGSIDKAYQLALAMGDLAFGVTLTQFGLRIRIKEGTDVEAKKAMDPILANLIGKELMECKKADGIVLHATGIPHTMADADVLRALTIQPP